MVIAGAVMGIGHQPVAFAAHHGGYFGVSLPFCEAINHMCACAFQPARLSNIGGFVKAGFQLDQCCDRFTVFGRFAPEDSAT